MDPAREIGVGVIGLGLMGRTHVEAYGAASKAGPACRLVAVADPDAARLSGRVTVQGNLQASANDERLFDPRTVRTSTEAQRVIDDPEVELVSICTPTDTHVDLARRALRAGKHVLLEKPVSLDPVAIDELAGEAERAGRICMPAMCMRYWPGWSWLRDALGDGRHGAVQSAVFQRCASKPAWNPGFYADPTRSGGALYDLHVHDADLAHWLFGAPESIAATGTRDHVTALYRYAHGPQHVVLEGGWDHATGFPFRMRFVVVFERATAEFDLRRDPKLEISSDGRVETPVLDDWTGYDGEVRAVLESVRSGDARGLPTLREAAAVTRSIRRYGIGGQVVTAST
ncbi:MAG: Gfo/Idh/MocA family oxidoreductase [Planctomycetota bacterium]|nr:Gfo/Idh/MocA family oxidoreductase [Planctomycetota bacterium]